MPLNASADFKEQMDELQPHYCKTTTHWSFLEQYHSTAATLTSKGVGIVSRSLFAGPHSKCPFLSNREPWHGQSQVLSFRFHSTIQPRCGQTAEHWCSTPCSSRYAATLERPDRTTAPVPGAIDCVESTSRATVIGYCFEIEELFQHLGHRSAFLGAVAARFGTGCHLLVVREFFACGGAVIAAFGAAFTSMGAETTLTST